MLVFKDRQDGNELTLYKLHGVQSDSSLHVAQNEIRPLQVAINLLYGSRQAE